MSNQLDQLPYTLTKGVTATREGLVFAEPAMWIRDAFHSRGWRLVEWHDAAARLRYREGEPWCFISDGIMSGWIIAPQGPNRGNRKTVALHRLAAILCDDAEGFRVLHWCIENLGGSDGTA